MSRRSEAFRPEAPIVPELSAGAIVVHEAHGDVLLLHEQTEDRWSIPKGHVEAGESLERAAARELEEETGLARVSFVGEVGEVSYRFFDPKRATNVHKTSVYFLVRTNERRLRIEPIFDRAEWMAWDEALVRVPYETDRRMLEAARQKAGPARK